MFKIISTLFIIVAVLLCFSCDLEVVEDNLIIGNETIVKEYGGFDDESGADIIQTSNGDYALFGTSSSFGDKDKMYLVFTDKNGNQINSSELTYGDSIRGTRGNVIIPTINGYALVGSNGDMNLILIDENGNELSSNSYGGANNFTKEWGNAIVQSPNGNFAILGTAENNLGTEWKISLVLTESDGTMINGRKYAIGQSNFNYGHEIISTTNGFALLCYSIDTVGKTILILTDQEGEKLNEFQYEALDFTYGNSMIETNDGGFAIVGYTFNSGNDRDVYFLHIDGNGDILNSNTYGAAGNDYGRDIIQRADGSFVIIGDTESNLSGQSDMYLIFIDENGNEISSKTFGNEYADFGEAIIQTEDEGLGLFRTTTDMDGGRNFYFVKTDADGNL